MKFKSLLTVIAAVAVAVPSLMAADEDTPLAKTMSGMNKSLRALKRQVADPAKKDDNLALVAKIKEALAEAAKLEPAQTKDIPAAEKAAYLDKYRAQITELGKTFDAIEAALKAGKGGDAKALFEKLSEQKEKGHKDFGVDDDH